VGDWHGRTERHCRLEFRGRNPTRQFVRGVRLDAVFPHSVDTSIYYGSFVQGVASPGG